MESEKKIPITLITGYLGSGKTSLLLHLIDKANRKLAILVNEFGELGIDGEIIQGKNIQMKELAGGCVCCSMTGELELAIKEILEKVKPEWIVIETTGVAEPGAIAGDIEENLPEIRLDAIVTMVDSAAMIKFPHLGHTGREQIELADIIIMNKIDIVSIKELQHVEKRLRELNPDSIIAKAIRGKIPPQFMFGLNKVHKVVKHDTHEIEEEHFSHETEKIFQKDKFIKFLSFLPKEVYRAKGFVRCKDNKTYLFSFVAGRHDMEEFENKDKSEFVFIGKDVLGQKEKILKKLEKIII
ncbi:MAG: GTP-binding protein [Candidatus Micrarchaeota archaeon]|nr:GTP-binding protein [Candidatus Micrarchaeota archaeon]